MRHLNLLGVLFYLAFATVLPAQDHAAEEWPQWRGPARDGIAATSPKLSESWPKEGPPLVWKSESMPAWREAGCGSPVVADGKVFLYLNNKKPVEGGTDFHLITTELLTDWGWLPDLSDALAVKIEEAWASPNRPSSKGWEWWDIEW